ncbi:hypothetical protein [Methanospirillum sp.]|uniref:hypothetical protein n=1 Tax=Methanospirillum sp. TaxID=45200 RepID=UPI0035A0394D
MPAINVILDEINELGTEGQEYVIEIVKNRIKDKKRFELAVRAKEALQNVKDGKVKSGGFNELWSDLND